MTQPQTYTPGPCDPWPIRWPARCDLSAATPEITGIAAELASELNQLVFLEKWNNQLRERLLALS